jgi:hypothetical protein
LRETLNEKSSHEVSSWREFEQIAKPGFDSFGRPILQSQISDKPLSLGISPGNLFSNGEPSELQREVLVTRLRAELTAGRAPRSSKIGVRNDLDLLQKLVAGQREAIAARADAGN